MIFTKKKDKRSEIEKEVDYQLSQIFSDLKKLQAKEKEDEQDFINRRQRLISEAFELYEKSKKGREKDKKSGPSWDTILVCGFSLIEVLAMLHYEKLGVITSKVMGRMLKGRV